MKTQKPVYRIYAPVDKNQLIKELAKISIENMKKEVEKRKEK